MSVVPLYITAHIENQGDMAVSGPQQFVGTKGQSRRLEGFSISPPAGVELEYMAHIENQGDTHWVRSPQYVGTKGQGRRMEGFAVRVVGHSHHMYDVKYYGHVANYGDTPVCSNGDFVGTRGQARRVEGLAIWLEARGGGYASPPIAFMPTFTPAPVTPVYPVMPTYAPAPAYTPAYTPVTAYTPAGTFTAVTPVYGGPPPTLTVTAFVHHQGPITVYGNQFAGTKGQGRKMEAFSLNVSYPGLTVEYMAHIEGRGDTHWHSNGALVGNQGGGRIEGFAVRLSGPAAGQFDVKYYGHVEGQGDTPVVSGGQFIGTRGQSRRCEGLAVWLEQRRY